MLPMLPKTPTVVASSDPEDPPFSPTAQASSPLQGHGEYHGDDGDDGDESPVNYRVYKRRFFGLFQLVLLNIIVSWDVCSSLPSSIWSPFVPPCADYSAQSG